MSNEAQIQMFGTLSLVLDSAYNNAVSKGAYIMGIMSDSQEMMVRGDVEGARKAINVAKYLIAKNGIQMDDHGRLL